MLVALAPCLVPSAATAAGGAWRDRGLHVVGGPIVSGQTLVVIDVTAQRTLAISGVNPANGSVVWSHPYSASQMTPGVAFTPVAVGDVVLVVSPAGAATSPLTRLEGVDAATGRVRWRRPEQFVLPDAPVLCLGGTQFCVPFFVSARGTDLISLNPLNGDTTGVLPGPFRNMGVAPPGSQNDTSLWQTDASTPTFLQLSPTGQVAWTRTVASLFGSSRYNPNDGWDFIVQHGTDIGTVGAAASAHSYQMGQYKTLGVSASTGALAWSTPGFLFCGGGLQMLAPVVICRYQGTATFHGTTVDTSRVRLTLEGVSTSSGSVSWHQKVRDVHALSLGTDVAFSDASHLVVQRPSGAMALLDVRDGTTSQIGRGEVFWCEETTFYAVQTAPGASSGGKRASEPVFGVCSSKGRVANAVPTTRPATVGVSLAGEFVWPSPAGLRAVATSG
jgi:outer membrane protein assembly factor BamB